MNFDVSTELALFAESVRAAIGDWQPPREPELGSWQDDRDDELAARVAAAGWSDLWAAEELLGAVVAGGIELGRVAAPVCLLDEATLGAPLCVEGTSAARARRAVARGAAREAVGSASARPRPRPDRSRRSTAPARVLVESSAIGELEAVAAAACWRAWNAATLAYLAGLAARALELAVEHARRGSSSARRSRRFRLCSPASPTPRSRRTR